MSDPSSLPSAATAAEVVPPSSTGAAASVGVASEEPNSNSNQHQPTTEETTEVEAPPPAATATESQPPEETETTDAQMGAEATPADSAPTGEAPMSDEADASTAGAPPAAAAAVTLIEVATLVTADGQLVRTEEDAPMEDAGESTGGPVASAGAPVVGVASSKPEVHLASAEVDSSGAMLNAATLHAQQILQAATAALAHVSNTPLAAPQEEPTDAAMEEVRLADAAADTTHTQASPAQDTHHGPPPSPFLMPAAARKHPHANDSVGPPAPAVAGAPVPPTTPHTTVSEKPLSRAMARSVPVSNGDGDITRCPCGDNKDQEGFMIQCEACEIWQHGICVGLTEKTTPEKFFCELCEPDNPIHQLFRRTWGDRTPVKGRAHKPKGAKRKGETDQQQQGAAANAAANAKEAPATPSAGPTPRVNPKDKKQRQAAAAAGGKPGDLAANTSTGAPPLAPATNKRKRTAEEQAVGGSVATPKLRGGRKVDSEVSGASPDMAKKPRLEDSLNAQAAAAAAAAQAGGQSSAPATPAAHRGQTYTSSGEYDHLPSTPLASSMPTPLGSDLAALAAELGPDGGGGGDLTLAGSREARKIQRYIQLIQKMETSTTTAGQQQQQQQQAPGTGRKLERTEEEGDDADEGGEESHTPQASGAVDIQLQQAYGAAAAARMARARLRSEKLERQESHHPTTTGAADEPTTGGSTDHGPASGTEKATQAAREAREKKKGGKVAAAKKEEVPALTPQEIRKLRLTASSQLRPLGPMYFGRKQFALQSYRDEALRCETGWAGVIHEELPMVKRVVHQYRLNEREALAAVHQRSHHHHHPGHPSSIFPASHPWSIPHPPRASKAAREEKRRELEQQQQEEVAAAAADVEMKEAGDGDKKPPVGEEREDQEEEDATSEPEEGGARPMEVDGAAPVTPTVKAEASGANAGGSGSGGAAFPPPAAFFASIDTTSLPTRVQQLISSFQASPQPPRMPSAQAESVPPTAQAQEATASVHEEQPRQAEVASVPMDESESQAADASAAAPSTEPAPVPTTTEIAPPTTTTPTTTTTGTSSSSNDELAPEAAPAATPIKIEEAPASTAVKTEDPMVTTEEPAQQPTKVEETEEQEGEGEPAQTTEPPVAEAEAEVDVEVESGVAAAPAAAAASSSDPIVEEPPEEKAPAEPEADEAAAVEPAVEKVETTEVAAMEVDPTTTSEMDTIEP